MSRRKQGDRSEPW
ncbi:unnamed protein product [Linum tenue]|uniref:Uncharacterized protein n=1 Tax=Linum tenue TaxID=586396 RepID=A0AAV0K712_9ROSI|nr:unnamed protein product [Linum tenue]